MLYNLKNNIHTLTGTCFPCYLLLQHIKNETFTQNCCPQTNMKQFQGGNWWILCCPFSSHTASPTGRKTNYQPFSWICGRAGLIAWAVIFIIYLIFPYFYEFIVCLSWQEGRPPSECITRRAGCCSAWTKLESSWSHPYIQIYCHCLAIIFLQPLKWQEPHLNRLSRKEVPKLPPHQPNPNGTGNHTFLKF